jgi:hypothetical protein
MTTITLELSAICAFTVQKEEFSHDWTMGGSLTLEQIARHVARAAAHGLKQYVGDATANLKTEAEKEAARHKAFARRVTWLNSDPRGPAEDTMWREEADNVLRALEVGFKARALAVKTVDTAKAAILAAAGPIAGETYIKGIDRVVGKRKAALADPKSALAALAALAAEADEEEMEEAAE